MRDLTSSRVAQGRHLVHTDQSHSCLDHDDHPAFDSVPASFVDMGSACGWEVHHQNNAVLGSFGWYAITLTILAADYNLEANHMSLSLVHFRGFLLSSTAMAVSVATEYEQEREADHRWKHESGRSVSFPSQLPHMELVTDRSHHRAGACGIIRTIELQGFNSTNYTGEWSSEPRLLTPPYSSDAD